MTLPAPPLAEPSPEPPRSDLPDLSTARPRIALVGAPGTDPGALTAALATAQASDPTLAPFTCEVVEMVDRSIEKRLRGCALVLLMSLPDSGPAFVGTRLADGEAADARLRAALQDAGFEFQVIVGQGNARTRHALRAIQAKIAIKNVAARAVPETSEGAFDPQQGSSQPSGASRWHAWGCENCGNPDCERRLFTALR